MLLSHALRASQKPAAAGPYVVSSATTTSASGLVHTVNVPTTRQSGDLLIMFANTRSNTTATFTNPSGWASLLTPATAPIAAAFYKVSNGAEASTVSVTINASAELNAIVMDIRDYTSINTIGAWAATDTTSPVTNSGITPTASGLLLGYWAIRPTGSTAIINVTAGPSGMTSAGEPTQQGLLAAAYYQDWAATATGSREVSLDTASFAGSHSLLVQIA